MTPRRTFLPAAILAASVSWCAAARPATQPSDDPFASVRRDAAVAAALADLSDADWVVQYRAVQSLARWRAPQAEGPLRAMVASSAKPYVRGRALVALARIRGQAAAPIALAATKDPAAALRAAALEALGVLGSPGSLAAVQAALRDGDAAVRHQALIALARLQGARAWPAIRAALADGDDDRTRCAATALAWVASDPAVDALVAMLEHKSAGVRRAAIEALAHQTPPKALEPLLARAAGDSDRANRDLAEAALARYPAAALRTAMLAALGGAATDRYGPAIRLLAGVADAASADALAHLLRPGAKNHRGVLEAGLDLLADQGATRYRDLFEANLASKTSGVRRAAVRGLGRCEGVDLFALLGPVLADTSSPVRQEVLKVVRRRTTGAPPGGIAVWIAPAMSSRHSATQHLARVLLAERLRANEVPGAIESLRGVLSGGSDRARQALAAGLAQRADGAQRRRLAEEQGYVTHWRICGPWPSNTESAALRVAFAAERDALAWSAGGADAPAPWEAQKAYPLLAAAQSDRVHPWRAEEGPPPGWRLSPPPPSKARRTILAFPLSLPAEPAAVFRAKVAPAPAEAGKAGPVRLRVLAGGKPLAEEIVPPDAKERALEVSLAPWAGGEVTLSLVVEPAAATGPAGAVVVRGPVIRAGAKRLADLSHPKLPPLAMVGRDAGGDEAGVRWQAAEVAEANGRVLFHDILPPPTHQQAVVAVADLTSARAREVWLDVDADDTWRGWLNGAPLPSPSAKTPRPLVKLRQGANRLVVKVVNVREWWFLAVRVADAEGRRVDLAR